MVYLIHFDRPYKQAKHYTGSTRDLDARLARHRAGDGARLLQVLNQNGIGYQVVRTWEGGRDIERKVKAMKNAPHLCPVCHPNNRRAQLTQKETL